jgi:hypothetical protein
VEQPDELNRPLCAAAPQEVQARESLEMKAHSSSKYADKIKVDFEELGVCKENTEIFIYHLWNQETTGLRAPKRR